MLLWAGTRIKPVFLLMFIVVNAQMTSILFRAKSVWLLSSLTWKWFQPKNFDKHLSIWKST